MLKKGWYNETSKGLKKPISKGQWLVIVHTGGEKELENELLIFKSDNFNKDQIYGNLPII